jgi:hypothetical protein
MTVTPIAQNSLAALPHGRTPCDDGQAAVVRVCGGKRQPTHFLRPYLTGYKVASVSYGGGDGVARVHHAQGRIQGLGSLHLTLVRAIRPTSIGLASSKAKNLFA